MRKFYDCLLRGILVSALLFSFSFTLTAQIQSTNVAIGGGKLTGGPATSEVLSAPTGVAVSSLGVYIADSGGQVHLVSNGIMTTIAGGGYGGAVQGVAATTATLSVPRGIVVDGNGNVYFSESGGNRVRKVTPAGIITTIAGTGTAGYNGDGIAADSAELNMPSGLVFDSLGNLYIADEGNNRIRKLGTDGRISTIAGIGIAGYNGDNISAVTAELNEPYSLAIDSSGNLFVGELGNYRVRKINTTDIISTYAGNGTANNPYMRIGPGMATASVIDDPRGLAVDSAGNLYISLGYEYQLVEVDTTGNLTVFADPFTGVVDATLSYPGGLTIDSTGAFYVANQDYNTVIGFAPDYGHPYYVSTIAGNGTGNYAGNNGVPSQAVIGPPLTVFTDNTSVIYFTDGNALRQVSGGLLQTFAGTGVAGSAGDGGPADSAQLNQPYGIFKDPIGNVYVGTRGDNKIRKISTAGIISTFAGNGTAGYSGDGGQATQASLAAINGISGDAYGNIYVSDSLDGVVRKIDTFGIIHTIAGTGVSGYAGDGGPATKAQLGRPNGLGVDNQGNIYVGDDYVNTVRKIDTTGIITTIVGGSTARGYGGEYGPGTAATFGNIMNILVDGLGTVYVVDPTLQMIRQYNVHTGEVFPFTGSVAQWPTGTPTSVAIDGGGFFYVSNTSDNEIVQLNVLYDLPVTDDTVTEYVHRPYFSGPATAYYNLNVIENDTPFFDWRHIMSLEPSYGSTVFNYNPLPQGLFTFINHVDTAVQTWQGIPLDTRHYEIIPPAGGDSAQDAIEVWFSLTDAQNYDNYVAAHNLGLPLMVNSIHQTLNGNNIRILAFHGQGNTPVTPNISNIEVIDPNQVGEDPTDFDFNLSVPRYIITFQTMNGFSGFYITTGTPTTLPLTLLSFTGTPQGNDALLHWTTTNEVNTQTFFVQRSPDTSAFATVGSVAAQNTAGTNSYGYTDKGLVPGNYFYRLKMQDITGNYTYSPIVEIPIGATGVGSILLYPNPAKDIVYCQIQAAVAESCILQLTDRQGNILQTQEANLSPGQTTLSFNIAALSSGSYFIVTVVNSQKTVQEFVK